MRRSGSEVLDPFHHAVAAKSSETCDVALPRVGQDHADWRNVVRGYPATAKDYVDQRPPCPPIAIIERMDRFELRVHQRRLDQRRQEIVVHRGVQIIQKARYFLHWRRYVIRTAWRVVVPADPVLSSPEAPGNLRPWIM